MIHSFAIIKEPVPNRYNCIMPDSSTGFKFYAQQKLTIHRDKMGFILYTSTIGGWQLC